MAKINHTAEQIDRKLTLIDENKNLLPYPYRDATNSLIELPEGFEDIGDGSILTTAKITDLPIGDVAINNNPGNTHILRWQLASCDLPAGSHVASLEVTDFINGASIDPDPGLSIILLDSDGMPTIGESAGRVDVWLTTRRDVEELPANLLIKPQIEAGTQKTGWVPYMGTVGSYVDERFNSTNAKIRHLANKLDNIDLSGEYVTKTDLENAIGYALTTPV